MARWNKESLRHRILNRPSGSPEHGASLRSPESAEVCDFLCDLHNDDRSCLRAGVEGEKDENVWA